METSLPIDRHLNRIKSVLQKNPAAVVQAPPGAGKTTRVPLALLDEPWLAGKKIYLLEPRRLAAVSCAGHMAACLGEKTGQTIGYRIRLDKKTGPKTKIVVITEGIFTRMIQHDPALEDAGLVIFDEFHERNIHSDLGLAFVIEAVEALRPDLRILVMSATLDTGRISGLLGNAPVIASKGKSHPVTTRYRPPVDKQKRNIPIETACAGAIREALSGTTGDILVFLPGVGEIMRLKSLLDTQQDDRIQVVPLFGNLPAKEQNKVFAKALKGKRKVIVATAIAETSITIDGIRTVVDSGLMRTVRFSPQTGMNRLVTLPVSKASADQRRGRAGRTAPGTCYRLWSEYDHSLLNAFSVPEILSSDLAGVMLELAAWGVSDPAMLKWLDVPETGPVDQAKGLLKTLGALDEKGGITGHGKKMARAGLHPRLSHMVLMAQKKSKGFSGCRLAALLMEKDIVRFDRGRNDPDIRLRLELIEKAGNKNTDGYPPDVNKQAIRRLFASERKIAGDFHITGAKTDLHDAGELLAHAYPDRIARKRKSRALTYVTASGKGICFSHTNSLTPSDYIVAVQSDGNPKNANVWLAAPYSLDLLKRDFKQAIQKQSVVEWDENTREVRQVERTCFKKLVLEEKTMPITDENRAIDLFVEKIRQSGLDTLPWTDKTAVLRDRICFLKQTGFFPDLPDLSDEVLLKTLDVWLPPYLNNTFSFSALDKLDLSAVFSALLTWNDRKTIEKNAPTHIIVPSGSKKRLAYTDRTGVLKSPLLQVRLQEMFGLVQTPMVAGNRIPVTIHLLSPAGRAVQITRDLKSFWKNTYPQVKKDLMGRYPKHYWPDDPYMATPTSRVRPGRKRS